MILMKKAVFFEKEAQNSVTCTACERKCRISEGMFGSCGVRVNKDGDLFCVVYGNVTEAYADPIEKKKLSHVLPGEKAFSIGTIGCNFSCDFCLNWEISQVPKELVKQFVGDGFSDTKSNGTHVGYDLSPIEVVEYCLRRGYRIIAYTYNEPTIWIEYALDISRLGRKHGLKSVFVTNGYMSGSVVEKISETMDAVAIDLKSFDEKFYRKHCKASLEPVLRNIKDFYSRGIWVELTTLVIPGENDSVTELHKIADFIAGVSSSIPWHIIQFSPDYKLLDRPRTPEKTLEKAYDIGHKAGLDYVYLGNVRDEKRTSTSCPSCKERLISRDGYDTTLHDMFDRTGKCKKCGEMVPGVWN